jgi:hypothetical protein
MSNYLSCLIDCESTELACQISKLLDRSSRPIFEEDLLEGEAEYYVVIQEIEFPNKIVTHENRLIVNWENKDRFNFSDLMPIFSLTGISLALAHEMDSYIGSGDDDEDEQGRYWFKDKSLIESCNASDLNQNQFSCELDLMKRINT